MRETFGPEYVRPAQIECPDCSCCSRDLCVRGRSSLRRCEGHTSDEAQRTVHGCPCSAETTKDTAAWRLAAVRVVRMAREQRLPEHAEALLTALVEVRPPGGEPLPNVVVQQFAALKSRRLAEHVDGVPAASELGRLYLRARHDTWTATDVQVVDVDVKARTAKVECPAWKHGLVTVLLDQLLGESGLELDGLSGQWVTVDANLEARTEDLVLVGFRRTTPTVPQWMRIGADGDE
ncbi:hypothetical protein ACH4Q7_22385 [Streptomyces roseolus]|uniref:hypothetical protein n=1 Tax=Streptomyces roseolus TaxID=67358 RepID=UPI0037928C2C